MDFKLDAALQFKSSTGLVHARFKTLSRKARVVLIALAAIVLSVAHYTFIDSSYYAREQESQSHTQAAEFSWDNVSDQFADHISAYPTREGLSADSLHDVCCWFLFVVWATSESGGVRSDLQIGNRQPLRSLG